MTLHPRRRALRFRAATIISLTAVWILLWGDLSLANVLGGAALAVLVAGGLPMPRVDFHGKVHVPGLAYLIYRFLVDLVVASVQVARQALTPGVQPRGAVLAVHLRSDSDVYLTLTSAICTMVPGSVVVEAYRVTGVIYVHVLDVEQAGGIEVARADILRIEERVMRALASDAELAAAGLTRRPLTRSGGRRGADGARRSRGKERAG